MFNVALSSKSLYRLSRNLIYRVIHFTFNRSRRDINGRLIKQLLADDDLSAKVREIRILWAPSANLQPREGSKQDLELLGQALPRLHGLKTFVWDAQYPILSWLLEALRKYHPQCLLYIRHPSSQESAWTLPRLCGSCLSALDVQLATGQFQACKELHKVLYSTLTLRDLTITSPQSPFYNRQSEPLRLRSLELYGCAFDTAQLPVVWPILERLSLDRVASLPDVIPDISGLKSLKLRIDDSGDSLLLGTILRCCKRLEALDLSGCISSISEVDFCELVGTTLIKLRLHEEDVSNRIDANAALHSTVIGRIAEHCHNLRSLGLDLECKGKEWVSCKSSYHRMLRHQVEYIQPYTMLNYIADEFWFLTHLELNILINDPQNKHPTSPKATLDSVPEVWRHLWQQISRSRARRRHSITKPRMRSLDLIVGSKSSVSNADLHDQQVDQQRFTLNLSERDDDASLGIANVKCTELEGLLSKFSSSNPLWNHQQELVMNIATERARKGPHIKMPSVMDNEMVRPSPFWDKLDQERFSYR